MPIFINHTGGTKTTKGIFAYPVSSLLYQGIRYGTMGSYYRGI